MLLWNVEYKNLSSRPGFQRARVLVIVIINDVAQPDQFAQRIQQARSNGMHSSEFSFDDTF